MSTGKVWLVGAGPGDPGLFTVKGREILQNAEVVVYDSLVGQGVLSQIPKEAKAINVGKRASHHTMPQEKINQVLVEEAKKGYRVVRLKGGDPFLFGRGGEELELLTLGGLRKAVVDGDVKTGSVMAGQIAGMVKEKMSCHDLIQKLVKETDDLIGGKGFYE